MAQLGFSHLHLGSHLLVGAGGSRKNEIAKGDFLNHHLGWSDLPPMYF
jgi:hypothetical protein